MRFTLKHLASMAIAALALTGCASTSGSDEYEDQVGVQLFMWNWNSVAAECEYLGAAGFDWALVSPPQESVPGEAWWVVYQPVSYQLESQLGTAKEFKAMVDTCAGFGVDIYADAVINHMTGGSEGVGTAGTEYVKYEYADLYTRSDFHSCDATVDGQIADWADLTQVQECELLGLSDLNTSDASVQAKIVAYLKGLLDLGVKGFRIDAAKHISTQELAAIKAELPADIDFLQEVIPGTSGAEPSDYLDIGSVYGFDFTYQLASIFSQEVAYLPDTATDSPWVTPSNKTIVMVSNHDTERNGQSLGYLQPLQFEAATALMLGMGYGQPILYSSFAFDNYDWAPKDLDGHVLDAKCAQSSAIYFENHEAGTWLCQHRMNSVNGMIEFRDLTSGEPLVNPQTQEAFVSFERGTKGLFAVNVAGTKLAGIELATNLPDGKYLDRISGKEFEIAAGLISFDLGPNQAIALTKK